MGRGIEHDYVRRSQEMDKFIKENADNLPSILKDKDFGSKIIVYENGTYLWDAICGYGTYGYKEGLLEIAGSIAKDDVEGLLTADDIISRL